MKALFICGFCLATLAVGCTGGGSTPVATPTPTPLPVVPLETRLRTIKTGDTFSYSFSRRITTTQGGVSNTSSSTGTLNIAISTGSLDNLLFLFQNNTATYTVQGQPFTLDTTTYFRQDPTTGEIVTFAEASGNTIYRMTIPWATAFGTWQDGLRRAGGVIFTNKASESRSFTVSGTEVIIVPAGRFDTWRVLTTRSSNQDQESGIYWYAPQLGTFVKSSVTVLNNGTGEEVITVAELRSFFLL